MQSILNFCPFRINYCVWLVLSRWCWMTNGFAWIKCNNSLQKCNYLHTVPIEYFYSEYYFFQCVCVIIGFNKKLQLSFDFFFSLFLWEIDLNIYFLKVIQKKKIWYQSISICDIKLPKFSNYFHFVYLAKSLRFFYRREWNVINHLRINTFKNYHVKEHITGWGIFLKVFAKKINHSLKIQITVIAPAAAAAAVAPVAIIIINMFKQIYA